MKALPFKIPKPENSPLIYQEDIERVFYDKLHPHDEIQISFIERGKGTLLVGDGISSYSDNDIFVIGSNLPHAFKSDKKAETTSKMLSLFFTEISFGEHFFSLNDFSEINHFLLKSVQGFVVRSNQELIIDSFLKLKQASKLERFILFLDLLKTISVCKTDPLTNFINDKEYSDIEGTRMRDVFDFTIEHAHQKISLETIASVANMTKTAFCKYFKKRTNKTYVSFLTELRVKNACKLLMAEKETAISEIAYATGFNNISNFNRQFKLIKSLSPSQFRKNSL